MRIQVGPRGRKQAWAAHLEEAVPTNLVVVVQLLSRVQLCDPMDCSTPDSVGLSRQEDLEWVSVSFFRGSSRLRDRTCVSCIGRRILYHRCPPIFRHAVKTGSEQIQGGAQERLHLWVVLMALFPGSPLRGPSVPASAGVNLFLGQREEHRTRRRRLACGCLCAGSAWNHNFLALSSCGRKQLGVINVYLCSRRLFL